MGQEQPEIALGKQAGASNSGGGRLAHELSVVPECVETGAPARVYSVSICGFDTHTAERATHQRLLTQLDQAVIGFIHRMSGTPRGHNVVLMAYSEFGRRVAANAHQGTDHGTSSDVILAGRGVR